MKKKIFTALQILVTLATLWWVFHDPVKREHMWQAILGADKWWFLAAIISYGVVELLAAVRWLILLRVQEVHLGWWRVVRLLMVGIFFNLFMPGGTGGDVIKSYFLLKETPGRKGPALLAVLMDRLLGLVGLIVVSGIVVTWRWDWLTEGKVFPHFHLAWIFSPSHIAAWLGEIPNTVKLLYTLLLILGSSITGIVFSFCVSGFKLAHRLPAKMPGRDQIIDLSIAYGQYARAWPQSLAAMVISFGVHIGSFLVFYYAALALHMKATVMDFMAIMPIINTLAAMPVSVGGAGVREGMFQEMLGSLCGVPAPIAVATSLLGYAVLALWAVVGGIIYMTYRPSEHARISEMKNTVHALEHEIAERE
jgi:uncharacterized membrane protein YbhN (UPF0104 family)